MKLLLVGSIAAGVYGSVLKFGGETGRTSFDAFFENSARQLTESSSETSAENSNAGGMLGDCHNAVLFDADLNPSSIIIMDPTFRTAECDRLTPECRSLYNACAKFDGAFCLSNDTSLEKLESVLSENDDNDFDPEACSACSKQYLASTLKSAVRVLDYAKANDNEEIEELDKTKSSIDTVLSFSSLMCMKDNEQKYCGARMNDGLPASAESFTAQSLCDACGEFDKCSDACKAKFETLMDLFDSCSLGFLQMLALEEALKSEGAEPTSCVADIDLKSFVKSCGVVGAEAIKPRAKTVLNVETSMDVLIPLNPGQQKSVKDIYCKEVQRATGQAAGIPAESVLMKCAINEKDSRRRLLATSYTLSAKVLQPVAVDDNSGYSKMPAGFSIPDDTLTAVSAAVSTGILADASLKDVGAQVPPPTAEEPTAEELADEEIAEYTRVATEKTRVGITITEAELASLPDSIQILVTQAVAAEKEAMTAPPTEASAAPTEASAAPTEAVAAPTEAVAAPTTEAGDFSAALGRDAWSVAAALVVAAAVANL